MGKYRGGRGRGLFSSKVKMRSVVYIQHIYSNLELISTFTKRGRKRTRRYMQLRGAGRCYKIFIL
jgi:hypothetical protein